MDRRVARGAGLRAGVVAAQDVAARTRHRARELLRARDGRPARAAAEREQHGQPGGGGAEGNHRHHDDESMSGHPPREGVRENAAVYPGFVEIRLADPDLGSAIESPTSRIYSECSVSLS